MTDGEAHYPGRGMNSLKKIQADYPNKLRYSGIEFSNGSYVLKRIAA